MSGTTLSQNGATDTIYISQVGDNYYYNINNGDNSPLVFPDTGGISVINTNISASTNILKIIFTTDLTLSNTNQYFTCQSDGIQFGNSSLNLDGSVPIINITSGANNYSGFIENGTSIINGFNNIYVYNLFINGNSQTTYVTGGWLGKQYFGNGASNMYIINCGSSGYISNSCGGIIGFHGNNLKIIGCYSEGNKDAQSGGIIGSFSTNNIIYESFSLGNSIAETGGIVGGTSTNCLTSNCYSIGDILYGGGIFNINCSSNQANCPSRLIVP